MKLVGITQRIDCVVDRNELRDAVDQRLINWVVRAGFLPMPVPNVIIEDTNQENKNLLEKWLKEVKIDGLILSGGNDIGEFKSRDLTENYLLTWAQSRKIPVLGICRGMQMMAVCAGVKLIRKSGHTGGRHQLIVHDSQEIWPSNVNSFHKFCLDSCPVEFHITAKSEDGSIEAIKHNKLPWEGWMWHPEREDYYSPKDTQRLKRLLNET